MAGRSRKRLAEWALVFLSIGFTCLCIEIGYRIYLYYTYAVVADYPVVTLDARQPRVDLEAPDNVSGPNPISAFYNATYYNGKNEVVYRNKVRTNNLGWTSRYDYSVAKAPGEYRIAVVGGSTTAAVTNELAWTDVVQDRLNSDRGLLAALVIERFSVLNIGFLGAGMSTIAGPGTEIARRFSPDLMVVNISIETLALDRTQESEAPAKVKEIKVPTEPDFVPVKDVEIPLYCTKGPTSLSNLDCIISPLWYVPPGPERSAAEIAEIKQTAARRRLLYAVLLSPRPLALLEILGRPVIPRAQAAESTLNKQQQTQLNSMLGALQLMRGVQPHLLLTHNPHIWHAQPAISLQIDELIVQLKRGEFDIVKMSEYMPWPLDSDEAKSWYMFSGHWSDKGAEIYGDSVAHVVRQRLLAERSLGPKD